jgi:hypothetical protein
MFKTHPSTPEFPFHSLISALVVAWVKICQQKERQTQRQGQRKKAREKKKKNCCADYICLCLVSINPVVLQQDNRDP